MKKIIQKAITEHILTKEEIVKFLLTNEVDYHIFEAADSVRKHYVGEEIYLRALIEFSNICQNDCWYCGLRCSNKNVSRYTLSEGEILRYVDNAVNVGYKTVVLQSGESSVMSLARLVHLIKEIKKYDVALTLSLGEKTYDEFKAYKEAGADRYLLRIETTDKNLYAKMHPNMSFSNRIRCLQDLKKLGYEVGTGCLVGLPKQTVESLAEDILFFKNVEADMVGIGPLITHLQTPLKNLPNGDLTLALKVMAITRLLLPDINIPATTAMETIEPNGRVRALQSGANVIMPNIMDDFYKDKYEIYPNKNKFQNNHQEYKKMLEYKLFSIGRRIDMSRGNSLKWERRLGKRD